VPEIAEYHLDEVSVGFRPGTPDNLPLIGRLDARTVAATGHYRNGIALIPATAAVVVALLAGDSNAVPTAFDPLRFGSPREQRQSELSRSQSEAVFEPESPPEFGLGADPRAGASGAPKPGRTGGAHADRFEVRGQSAQEHPAGNKLPETPFQNRDQHPEATLSSSNELPEGPFAGSGQRPEAPFAGAPESRVAEGSDKTGARGPAHGSEVADPTSAQEADS
jgi:hypothetical protein